MQQSEVHKHTIETAVFKWELVCIALRELNFWKQSPRDRYHFVGEIDSCGNRTYLFHCG
jgi:hypothetical protein